MANMNTPREHWYDGIVEAVQTYIPGNATFRTMRARNARIGTLFILPFIILRYLVFLGINMIVFRS